MPQMKPCHFHSCKVAMFDTFIPMYDTRIYHTDNEVKQFSFYNHFTTSYIGTNTVARLVLELLLSVALLILPVDVVVVAGARGLDFVSSIASSA